MDSNLYNNIGKLLGDIKKAEYIAFVIGWRSAEIRYFDKRITSDIQITEDSYNESWKDRQTDSTHQTYIDGWRRAEARLKSINLSDVAANKVHIHEASVDFIRSEYQRTYGSVFLDLE